MFKACQITKTTFSAKQYLITLNSLGQLKAKAKKKSSLVSGNRSGENFFITHPLAYSNVHQNIYFLIKKKNRKKITRPKKKRKRKKRN